MGCDRAGDERSVFQRSKSLPKFHMVIPHPLTAAEAKSRLERFTEAMHAKFSDKVADLNQSWNDNLLAFGFKTFGIKISGSIEVHEDRLHVEGELPFSAIMFKGKIESEMREQLTRLTR